MLAELAGILTRAKFVKALAATGLPREELVLGYAELAAIVQPATIPLNIAADPSDDQVLACALAASADFIVSGDKYLLGLGGQYQGIPIVTPAQRTRSYKPGNSTSGSSRQYESGSHWPGLRIEAAIITIFSA